MTPIESLRARLNGQVITAADDGYDEAHDQARVPDNFGINYAPLRDVKRAYDPQNLFHLNQNIVP
jgi:FAD/FMN-containing dehydrogenase